MAKESTTDLLQDVFGWDLYMTGPNELHYRGEYLGIGVAMLIETIAGKQLYQFVRLRTTGLLFRPYSTAEQLYDSFPKIHAEEDE